MDAEGAASGAPDDDEQLAQQPLEVAAASATIITGSLPSTTEAPSAELGEVKEEQPDYSDPADTPEVETVNLLGLEESEPSLTTTTPVEEGAAPSAPAEPSVEATVIEGQELVEQEVAKIPSTRS